LAIVIAASSAILMLAVLVLLALGLRRAAEHRGCPLALGQTVLHASALWGLLVVLITESLSAATSLTAVAVRTAWTAVFLLEALAYMWLRGKGVGAERRQRRWRLPPLDPWAWIMLAIVVIQMGLLGLVALHYPPNTWDSMTYHMPRVMHWVQGHSMTPFATADQRQLMMPPFAEYVILQLWLLAGSDVLANLVQWSALVVILIGAYEIARALGLEADNRWAAVLLASSIPMATLQATSTQNDLVVACWLTVFVAIGLPAAQGTLPMSSLVIAGVGLGLAVLTKGTALPISLPFAIVLATVGLRKLGRRAVLAGAIAAGLALAINLPFLARNMQVFGNLTGPSPQYINQELSLRSAASNVIRNLALHVPTCAKPNPVCRLGNATLKGLEGIHHWTGASPTDPKTTFNAEQIKPDGRANAFEEAYGIRIAEDYSGNTLHVVLILIALPFLAFSSRSRLQCAYTVAVVTASLAFCLVFKWQNWGSRLQLALFVLWAPLLASTPILTRRRIWRLVPIAISLVAFRWILLNPARPVSAAIIRPNDHRIEQYFTNDARLLPIYDRITMDVVASGCSTVGLAIGPDRFEYPLWTMLAARGFSGTIQYVNPIAETARFLDKGFAPCATIAEGDTWTPEWAGLTVRQDEFRLYLDDEHAISR
jgi:hypothetical protein